MTLTAAPLDRPATYQDVLDAPEGQRAELIDGALFMQARPMPPHDNAQGQLFSRVHQHFHRSDGGGPGGWRIVAEPELHLLRRHVLVPDLAGWRREWMPDFPREGRYPLAPDWACEVVSPSTAGHDRLRKMPVYAQAGIAHLWLVDPSQRTIEVFELSDGRYAQAGGEDGAAEARLAPFDALALPLGELWGIDAG